MEEGSVYVPNDFYFEGLMSSFRFEICAMYQSKTFEIRFISTSSFGSAKLSPHNVKSRLGTPWKFKKRIPKMMVLEKGDSSINMAIIGIYVFFVGGMYIRTGLIKGT